MSWNDRLARRWSTDRAFHQRGLTIWLGVAIFLALGVWTRLIWEVLGPGDFVWTHLFGLLLWTVVAIDAAVKRYEYMHPESDESLTS